MLHGAGYADTTLPKKQTFWRDVYGFDYSPVLECCADEPVVEQVDSDNLVRCEALREDSPWRVSGWERTWAEVPTVRVRKLEIGESPFR